MAESKIVFADGAGIAVKGSANEVQTKISRGRADMVQFTKADGHEADVYVVAANVAYVEQVPESGRAAA